MRPSLRFYDALPKRKAELIDGRMYVGGSLSKSAMTLGYMVERLGAEYVAGICPVDLIRDAVVEVYGRKGGAEPPMADFSPVSPDYYATQKLATDLMLSLYRQPGTYTMGGTTAIKLGEDVFMPDVYVIRWEKIGLLTEYYLDGAPDLIIEVVHPFMRGFDFGIRMERYAAAGIPEVWMLDYEKRSFEPFILIDGKYVPKAVSGEWHISHSIPEIRVQHGRLYESAEVFGIRIPDIFEVNLPEPESRKISLRKGIGYKDVPFAPRLDLDPVPITFPEFICWGGEVKFEMYDGKPVFGGGYETTKEWLGLLLMTLGMKEAVKYLPKEEWAAFTGGANG